MKDFFRECFWGLLVALIVLGIYFWVCLSAREKALYKIVNIDGCEYVQTHRFPIIHKANCPNHE